MTSPAMGTITFSDNVRIMEKIPAFHPCGVCPTSAAIVPTFSFTSPNIVDRLPFMAPMRISFIHSLIASSMLCISLYPRFLTEQPGKQRYKGHADKGNAAARHKLLHALAFRARIVVAVALHQIDYAPDTKPGSKCYNKGLQNVYCAIEKCHKYILSAASAAVRQADKRRSAYAAAQKNRPLVKAAVPALRKFCGAAVFSCRGCGSCRCVLRRKVGARIM